MTKTFEQLVAEGESEPVEGWDFSWFEGRATEQRPSWGYARSLVPRVASARAVLDIQTGGAEAFSGVLRQSGAPEVVRATESWTPNVQIARDKLAGFGGVVEQVADEQELPWPDATFDLVASRHPTLVLWAEIARVLQPGGTYFSQQVGPGSNRELAEYLMGPRPVAAGRSPDRAVAAAEALGLEVVDLRQEALEVRFYDIGSVVYFLRKVLWTVPGFTVQRYGPGLRTLHEEIEAKGSFVCYAQRFLIHLHKPI